MVGDGGFVEEVAEFRHDLPELAGGDLESGRERLALGIERGQADDRAVVLVVTLPDLQSAGCGGPAAVGEGGRVVERDTGGHGGLLGGRWGRRIAGGRKTEHRFRNL